MSLIILLLRNKEENVISPPVRNLKLENRRKFIDQLFHTIVARMF